MATRKKATVQIDESERCANCKHFGLDDDEKVCKRFPRQFVPGNDSVSMCYPPHFDDDVCGEFKRRTNA